MKQTTKETNGFKLNKCNLKFIPLHLWKRQKDCLFMSRLSEKTKRPKLLICAKVL